MGFSMFDPGALFDARTWRGVDPSMKSTTISNWSPNQWDVWGLYSDYLQNAMKYSAAQEQGMEAPFNPYEQQYFNSYGLKPTQDYWDENQGAYAESLFANNVTPTIEGAYQGPGNWDTARTNALNLAHENYDAGVSLDLGNNLWAGYNAAASAGAKQAALARALQQDPYDRSLKAAATLEPQQVIQWQDPGRKGLGQVALKGVGGMIGGLMGGMGGGS